MRSEITRGGRMLRPTVNWNSLGADNKISDSVATAQMVESLRNLSESYFADMFSVQQEMLRVLRRIDRRLASRLPLTGGRR